MKRVFCILTILLVSSKLTHSHGIGGHLYQPSEDDDVGKTSDNLRAGGKSLAQPWSMEEPRCWSISFTTGWTSREMHYGVNETGKGGAYVNELALEVHGFMLSAWSGFGTGNEYQEWDFAIARRFDGYSVFFVPGFNFRYQPGFVESGHAHGNEAHHGNGGSHDHEEDHGHENDENHGDGSEAAHTHNTHACELFFILGTNAIPCLTPNVLFVCDVNNLPGAYLELRLDGNLEVLREALTFQPYALLGLNLGYNTRDYYGWNNFQFGLLATWRINRFVSVFGGINYSVALDALEEIGQGNEVWANAGLRFSY